MNECALCDTEGPEETAEEAKRKITNPRALTWLFPNKCWICNKCLKSKSSIDYASF